MLMPTSPPARSSFGLCFLQQLHSGTAGWQPQLRQSLHAAAVATSVVLDTVLFSKSLSGC